ncbi:PREDICTED: dolichol kinase isoform X3 [Ceratosolen solmsi marchali]|uniref:dolichol kinase n=1 Tax=Ceratosolen solmsi marchali TaxID=326594 RepID=A0AAJ6YTN9_9HYME|nr:PREDICTED: dolichol kinase isoform X3 [Ceratosolen solmsi marchali]
MEILTRHYGILEKRILSSLAASNLRHRTKDSTGLWLGPLIGTSTLMTFLKEDSSYSEICLLTGIAGGGLIISCICLYIRLMMKNVAAKDFHVVYFVPAIILSTLFLLVGNKGLLVSVTWGIVVGSFSTWGVIQLISSCPNCFTLGEATAVTHSLVLFLVSAFTNLPLRYHLPPIHDNDIITAILQVIILYVILICCLCVNLPKLRQLPQFFLLMIGMLFTIVIPALYIILDQNPFFWVLSFAFSTYITIFLLLYWAVCLLFALFAVKYQISQKSKATTSNRKIFHVLVVMVYIPGLISQPTFLYLASGTVLVLFSIIELHFGCPLKAWVYYL